MSTQQDSNTDLALANATGLMGNAATDHLTLLTHAWTISNQPQVDLSLVQTAADSQGLATHHANIYIDSKEKGVLDVFEQIVGMKSKYDSTYAGLLKAAQESDHNGVTDTFRTGLHVVRVHVLDQAKDVEDIIQSLQVFNGQVGDDQARFDTDQKMADKKYAGPEGELVALRGKLKNLGQELADDNKKIARGAVDQIPKALISGIEMGAKFCDLPPVGELVLSTAVTIIDQTTDNSDPVADHKAKLQAYSDALYALKTDEQQMAILFTLRNNVDLFAAQLTATISTLKNVKTAWEDLAAQLDILSSYKTAPSNGYFAQQVEQGQQFWADMERIAQSYLTAMQKIQME